MKRLFILLIFSLFIFSCRQKSGDRNLEPSFYYWKSVFKPTEFEKKRLDSLGVKTIYPKFFDVDWDKASHKPIPAAKVIIIDTAWLQTKNIVATVFITNETIFNCDSSQIKNLAGNISQLLQQYIQLYRLKNIGEIQMDCDWTATTKEKYFYLLRLLSEGHKNAEVSATIRLHQLKYRSSTGVPPVKKGLLMCYNMGSLQQMNTQNSIIDVSEFAKYTGTIETYPLLLDFGLPLFDWYVLFRNKTYAGLLQSLPDGLLHSEAMKKTANGYLLQRDTLFNGRLLKTGDFLRYENSDYKSIQKIIRQIKGQIKNKNLKVSLYHCDSIILKKYSNHEIQNIYSAFH